MKNLTVVQADFDNLVNSFDWDKANDISNNRLFQFPSQENRKIIKAVFNHFDIIDIKDDVVFGVYKNGQKVWIAHAPDILTNYNYSGS